MPKKEQFHWPKKKFLEANFIYIGNNNIVFYKLCIIK
jgi:hypothetical protein